MPSVKSHPGSSTLYAKEGEMSTHQQEAVDQDELQINDDVVGDVEILDGETRFLRSRQLEWFIIILVTYFCAVSSPRCSSTIHT